MPVADVASATTVGFGTSSFAAFCESIEVGAITREAVRTTHLATTTAETYMPADLYDAGELQMAIQHDPDLQPPIGGAVETITITWPLPSGQTNEATHVFSGFLSSYTMRSGEANELMKADITIKITGAVTFNASS